MCNKRYRGFLTCDVEDWFHILDYEYLPNINEWDSLKNRVDYNTNKLLDNLLHENVKGTFFVLGWIAERNKSLVKRIVGEGHELASHGYAHFLYFKNNKNIVKEDLKKSKIILEDISGVAIKGFRAPGFSAKEENSWIYDLILKEGYIYDSSVFPAKRFHGGNKDLPDKIFTHSNGLYEFPISVIKHQFIRIPFGGGGYFRLYPLFLQKMMIESYTKRHNQPFMFYIHPREIDKKQPRFNKMSLSRKFRTYIGIKKSEEKLKKLLKCVNFIKIDSYLKELKEKA